jgi:nuclear pore complex protein Nup205
MQYFPGLTRGLTAILLYYDRKKLIVNTLKTLLLVRSGRTWILDETIPVDFVNFINNYIDELIKEGLIGNLISKFFF